MTWLDRLKNLDTPREAHYKTYETGMESEKGGFVGFVAYSPKGIQKTQAHPDSLAAPAAATESGPESQVTQCVLAVPAVSAPAPADPDRWCWPQSSAMTGTEITVFEARVHLFGARGLSLKEAEGIADKLVLRDRDADERRLCLECEHLQVLPENHWRDHAELRCTNFAEAGLCVFARDAGLSQAFARQLQRCHGFTAVTP